MQSKPLKISRRRFLQGSAVTAGALSLGLLDFQSWAKASAEAPVRRVPTLCNGCGNRCAVFAYVKNGRIWRIEGNPDANGNQGVLCPKGHGYLHDIYNPNRIRTPLKRVEGKFQPISWEQAYKEISQKINLILLDNGPESIFWVNYPQPNQAYALRLMHSLGSPHYFTHGSTCYTARNAAWNFTVGKLPSNDLANSSYIMIIGRNPAGGIDLGQVKDIVKAKEAGAKVVVVDPRHNETAILADEWLPVKPGTDLAFLLAMINVMVSEKLYDKDFVASHTVGFEQLEDEIINYPPEWAEKICDIPAKTIIRITREIAANKPHALIHRGYHGAIGAQYLNSFQTARALAIANALLGNINRKGGIYFSESADLGELQPTHPAPEGPSGPKADGTGIPGRYPLGAYGDGISHSIPELALRGVLKCGFVYHHNPLRTNPNPKRVIAGYKKLDLLVVIDPVLSETASIAHYVLPASFYLEADEAVDTKHSGKRAQVSLQQKVIEPLFDSRSGFQIIGDLAKVLGVGTILQLHPGRGQRAAAETPGGGLERPEGQGDPARRGEMEGRDRQTGNPLGESGDRLIHPGKTRLPGDPPLGSAPGFTGRQGPSFLPPDPRQTGHPYPRHDGQSALSHGDQPPVRHDPAVDQPDAGGKDRPEGRGRGGNEVPCRRREDPGEINRGSPSFLCLAPQRLRDFFQAFDDGL